MIKRKLQLANFIKHKSGFLFGPRSTGKSFLIKHTLSEFPYIDLLKASDRRRYIADPSLLREVAQANPKKLIIIDEIQLVPELLDEVHSLIEETDCRFLLTGSSARKLKRSHANMLGGRARRADFFPLTWKELRDANQFDLNRYLLYGGIPRIYLSDSPEEELSDYVDTYLDQEIKAEAVSRNIHGFEQFFQSAAHTSGQVLNYSKIASGAQISGPTVRQYYEILEDTLLGFYLRPWKGPKRKAIQSSKFYLFDLGIKWFLAQVKSLPEKSDLFGNAFEAFIVQEIVALCSYRRLRHRLYFWRTTYQDEVDLIIGDKFAIEIKSTRKATHQHCSGLIKIKEEGFSGRRILLSRDTINRTLDDGTEMRYWEDFLEEVWTSSLS